MSTPPSFSPLTMVASVLKVVDENQIAATRLDASIEARKALSTLLVEFGALPKRSAPRSKKVVAVAAAEAVLPTWFTAPRETETLCRALALAASLACLRPSVYQAATTQLLEVGSAAVTALRSFMLDGGDTLGLDQNFPRDDIAFGTVKALLYSIPHMTWASWCEVQRVLNALLSRPRIGSAKLLEAGLFSACMATILLSPASASGYNGSSLLSACIPESGAFTFAEDDVPAALAVIASVVEGGVNSDATGGILRVVARQLLSMRRQHGEATTWTLRRENRSAADPMHLFVGGLLNDEQRWWLALVITHALQRVVHNKSSAPSEAGAGAAGGSAATSRAQTRTMHVSESMPKWVPTALVLLLDMVQYEMLYGYSGRDSIAGLVLTSGIESVLAEAAIEEILVGGTAATQLGGDHMFAGLPVPPLYSCATKDLAWSDAASSEVSAGGPFGDSPAGNAGFHMRLAVALLSDGQCIARSQSAASVCAKERHLSGSLVPSIKPWKLTGFAPPVEHGQFKYAAKGAKVPKGSAKAVPIEVAVPAVGSGSLVYFPSIAMCESASKAALRELVAELQPAGAADQASIGSGAVKATARRKAEAAEPAHAPVPAQSVAVGMDTPVVAKRGRPRKVSTETGREALHAPLATRTSGRSKLTNASSVVGHLLGAGEGSLLPLLVPPHHLDMRPRIVLPSPPAVTPMHGTVAEGCLAMAHALQLAVSMAAQLCALSCVSMKSQPTKRSNPVPVSGAGGASGAVPAREILEAQRMYTDAMWHLNSTSVPMLRLPEPIGPSDLSIRRARLHLKLLQKNVLPPALSAASFALAMLKYPHNVPVLRAVERISTAPARFAQYCSTVARVVQAYVYYAPTDVGISPTAIQDAKAAAAKKNAFTHSEASAPGARASWPSAAPQSKQVASAAGFLPASLDSASTSGHAAYCLDNILSAAIEAAGDGSTSRYSTFTGENTANLYLSDSTQGQVTVPAIMPSWDVHRLMCGVETVLTGIPGIMESTLEFGAVDPTSLYAFAKAMMQPATSSSVQAAVVHAAIDLKLMGKLECDDRVEVGWLGIPPAEALLQSTISSRISAPLPTNTTSATNGGGYPRATPSSSSGCTTSGPAAAAERWPQAFHALYLRRRAVQACLGIAMDVVLLSVTCGNIAREFPGADLVKDSIQAQRYQLHRWGVLAVLRALAGWPNGEPVLTGFATTPVAGMIEVEGGKLIEGAPTTSAPSARKLSNDCLELSSDDEVAALPIRIVTAGHGTHQPDPQAISASKVRMILMSQTQSENSMGDMDEAALDFEDDNLDEQNSCDDDDEDDDEDGSFEDRTNTYRDMDGNTDEEGAEDDLTNSLAIRSTEALLAKFGCIPDGALNFVVNAAMSYCENVEGLPPSLIMRGSERKKAATLSFAVNESIRQYLIMKAVPAAPVSRGQALHPYEGDDMGMDICSQARMALTSLAGAGINVKATCDPAVPSNVDQSEDGDVDMSDAKPRADVPACSCCPAQTPQSWRTVVSRLVAPASSVEAGHAIEMLAGSLACAQPLYTLTPFEFYSALSGDEADSGAVCRMLQNHGQSIIDRFLEPPREAEVAAGAGAGATSRVTKPGPSKQDVLFETFLPLLRLVFLAQQGLARHAHTLPLQLTHRSAIVSISVPLSQSFAGPPTTLSRIDPLTGVLSAGKPSSVLSLPLLGPHSNAEAALRSRDPSALRQPSYYSSHQDASHMLTTAPGGYKDLTDSMQFLIHIAGLPTASLLPAQKVEGAVVHAGMKRCRVSPDDIDAEVEGEEAPDGVMNDNAADTLGLDGATTGRCLEPPRKRRPGTAVSSALHLQEPPRMTRLDPPTTPQPLESQLCAAFSMTCGANFSIAEEVILRRLPIQSVSALLTQNGGFIAWGAAIVGRRVALQPRHIHGLPHLSSVVGAASESTAQLSAKDDPASTLLSVSGVEGVTGHFSESTLASAYSAAKSAIETRSHRQSGMYTSSDIEEQKSVLREEYNRLYVLHHAALLKASSAERNSGGGEEEVEGDEYMEAQAMQMGMSLAQLMVRTGRSAAKRTTGSKALFVDLEPVPGTRPPERVVGGVPVAFHAVVESFEADTGAHVLRYDRTGSTERVMLPVSEYTLLPHGSPQLQKADGNGDTGDVEGSAVAGASAGLGAADLPPAKSSALVGTSLAPAMGGENANVADVDESDVTEVKPDDAAADDRYGGAAGIAGIAAAAPNALAAENSTSASSSDARPAEGPPPSSWACGDCTLVNPWSSTVCSLCGAGEAMAVKQRKSSSKLPNTSAPTSQEDGGGHATDYEWSCSRCTLRQAVVRLIENTGNYRPSGEAEESLVKAFSGDSTSTAIHLVIVRKCGACGMVVPYEAVKAGLMKASGSENTALLTLQRLGLTSPAERAATGMRSVAAGASLSHVSASNKAAAVGCFHSMLKSCHSAVTHKAPTRDQYGESSRTAGAMMVTSPRNSSASGLVHPIYLLGEDGATKHVRTIWNGGSSFPDSARGLKRMSHDMCAATAQAMDGLEAHVGCAPGELNFMSLHSPHCTHHVEAAEVLSSSPGRVVLSDSTSIGIGQRVDAVCWNGMWAEAFVVGLGQAVASPSENASAGTTGSSDSSMAAGTSSATLGDEITHVRLHFSSFSSKHDQWYPVKGGLSVGSTSVPSPTMLGTSTRDWRMEIIAYDRRPNESGSAGAEGAGTGSGRTPYYAEVRVGGRWYVGKVSGAELGPDFIPDEVWTEAVPAWSIMRSFQLRYAPGYPLDTLIRYPEAEVTIKFDCFDLPPVKSKGLKFNGGHEYEVVVPLVGDKVAPLGTHTQSGRPTSAATCSQQNTIGDSFCKISAKKLLNPFSETFFPATNACSWALVTSARSATASASAVASLHTHGSSRANSAHATLSGPDSAGRGPFKAGGKESTGHGPQWMQSPDMLPLGPLASHVKAPVGAIAGAPSRSISAPIAQLSAASEDDAARASFLWGSDNARSREFSLNMLLERATGIPAATLARASAPGGAAACPAAVLNALEGRGTGELVPRLKLRVRMYGRKTDIVHALRAHALAGAGGKEVGAEDGVGPSTSPRAPSPTPTASDLLCVEADGEWIGVGHAATALAVVHSLAARLCMRAGVGMGSPAAIKDIALVLARQVMRSPVIGLGHQLFRGHDYAGTAVSPSMSDPTGSVTPLLPSHLLEARGVHLQVQPVLVLEPCGIGPGAARPRTTGDTQPASELNMSAALTLPALLPVQAQACMSILLSLHGVLRRAVVEAGRGARLVEALDGVCPADTLAPTPADVVDRLFVNGALSLSLLAICSDLPLCAAGMVPSWALHLCGTVAAASSPSRLTGSVNLPGQGEMLVPGGPSTGSTGRVLLPRGLRALLPEISSGGVVAAIGAMQDSAAALATLRSFARIGQRTMSYDGRADTSLVRLEPGTVVDGAFVEAARLSFFRKLVNTSEASTALSRGGTGVTIGTRQRDRVTVDRSRLLDDGYSTLKLHALGDSCRAKLDVAFLEEKAFGEGVTQEFYACVAAELQRVHGVGVGAGLDTVVGLENAGASVPYPTSSSVPGALPFTLAEPGAGAQASHAAPPQPPPVDGSVLFHASGSSEGTHVVHPAGLFPRPLSVTMAAADRAVARRRWELIGLAMGKALQDSRIFPLPLSPLFLELVQDEVRGGAGALPSHNDMCTQPLQACGRILHAPIAAALLRAYFPALTPLLEVARARYALRVTGAVPSGLTLSPSGVSVEDLCLAWTDPASGFLLIKHAMEAGFGSSLSPVDPSVSTFALAAMAIARTLLTPRVYLHLTRAEDGGDVDTDSVDVFMALYILFHARFGIGHALAGFIEGIGAVVTPVSHLLSLSPCELRERCCGSLQVQWSMEDLRGHVQAGGGYAIDSIPVQLLFSVLVEMSTEERSDFLRFATGCPSLPAGGLPALAPPLKVVQKLDVPPMPLWMKEEAEAAARVAATFSSTGPSAAAAGGTAMDEGGPDDDGLEGLTHVSRSRSVMQSLPFRSRRTTTPTRTARGATTVTADDVVLIDQDSPGPGFGVGSSGKGRGRGVASAYVASPANVSAPAPAGQLSRPAAASSAPAPSPHDRALVSASTCFHQVRLPPYSSKVVLRTQLLEAIGASAGLIDFS